MRYLKDNILKDLQKKMVFIGGPRQCGKTTLAKNLLENYTQGKYFNWDYNKDKDDILAEHWHHLDELLVFDEIHKYSNWKNWLKGIYDIKGKEHKILVTGSARLDVYKRGGDSLLGRFHYWRLHPFALDEIPKLMTPREAFQRLMQFGGFPEPFLDADEVEARRWRNERLYKIIHDDIRDLETVKSISTMELLLSSLRFRAGNLVVIDNIAQDLHVSHATIKSWLEIFEKMYLVFSVYPYTKNLERSIQKPPKVYFFDNGDVLNDEGNRLENLVATHLLKYIHYLEDSTGFKYKLYYIRDKEGREVDFLVEKDDQVELLLEVKLSEEKISKNLIYYTEKLKPKKSIQLVYNLKRSYSSNNISVVNPIEFLISPQNILE